MKKEAREIVGGLFSAWRELRGLGIPFDQAAVLHEAKMLNLPQDPTALAELLAAIPDDVPDGVAERDWRLFHAAITKLAAEWRQMPAQSPATNTCVVLAAVHRLLFSEAAERIRSVNVVPDVVTTETAALLNFVIAEYLPHVESSDLSEKPGTNGSPSQHAELPLLIIEAGSSFSQAYYMAADLVKFYGLGIAGESWIRGIAKELKVTYTAAAKRSHDERQTDDLGRIYPFLQQFRRQAFDDVQRILERIRGEELEPPRTILVTGEAACIPGLIDGWITGCS